MNLKFSAPSKTFLIGEYGVLEGGSCVLAATGPRFEMSIESPGEGLAGGIHPHSPAGRWIRANPQDFNSVKMSFTDPHEEAGGFGASSSQFLFVNLWSRVQSHNLQSLLQNLTIEQVWNDFRALYLETPEEQRPSGGDVISQWQGGLTAFTPKPFEVEPLFWPSQKLEFALIRTHNKVATHVHLEQVKNKDYSKLKEISANAVKKIRSQDPVGIIMELRAFGRELEELGLVALGTQDILGRLKHHSSILAAKGCGALGADVIALFYRPEDRLQVNSFLAVEGFQVQSDSRSLSEGLKLSLNMTGRTAPKLVSVSLEPPPGES